MQTYSCIYHFHIKQCETVMVSTTEPNWEFRRETRQTHQDKAEILVLKKDIRDHKDGQISILTFWVLLSSVVPQFNIIWVANMHTKAFRFKNQTSFYSSIPVKSPNTDSHQGLCSDWSSDLVSRSGSDCSISSRQDFKINRQFRHFYVYLKSKTV